MTLEEQLNSKEKMYKDFYLFKRLYSYLKPELAIFIFGLFIDILAIAIYSFEPRIMGLGITFITEGKITELVILCSVFLAAITLTLVMGYYGTMIMQKVGQNIIYKMRTEEFEHIENFSINQLNSLPVGKLVTRVTNDTAKINNLFSNVIPSFVRSFFSLIFTVVQVLISSWEIGLILIIFIPISFGVVIGFRIISKKVFRETRKSISSLNGFLAENISGMLTTQIFNQQKRKLDEFDDKNNSLLKAYLHQVSFFAVFRPLFYLLYIVSVAIIVLYGSNLIINDPAGKYVAADLLTFYLYAGQFSNPMTSFAEQFNSFQESLTAMERICIILDVKPEVLDKEDAKDVDTLIGKVEFKHVWFSYIPGEWILKDVSFVINPGETAAFVGATGAGKSTIISLITRNYEAQKGEILIDDKPIGEYTLNSLRKHIGSMLQDVFLFAGTISENISLFDNAIDKKDVISSCEYVGANNFIEKLPNKYDEMIQERGNNFSMGQRQLISFARVVLYHPNIMLMDEATANIDTETEVLIQNSLKKMKNIGTMIIVAHRLSTIKHADKIFVISQGKIIESGNHQELLKVHGMYYNLYRLQNMEKKKDEEI